MTDSELAEAICDELGAERARRLYERWRKSQPLYRYAEEVKRELTGARQEMYFESSAAYEGADRAFVSTRVAELLDQAGIDYDARVFSRSGPPDILLEYDKTHELKEPVRTFGDLVDKEVTRAGGGEEVVVTRELDDYLFEPIHECE